ncbi:hypothetical protein EIP86_006796 [Pleurotus ostreatoroseus]|nr:hypothetical protein EIP86_006796 [Pleurotus ostreatoroseus]
MSGCSHKSVMKLSDMMDDMDPVNKSSTLTSSTTSRPSATIFFSGGPILVSDTSTDRSTMSSSADRSTATSSAAQSTSSAGNSKDRSSSSQKGGNEDDSDSDSDDDDSDNSKNGSGKGGNSSNNDSSSKGSSFSNNSNSGPGFGAPSLDPSCQLINDNDGRLQYTGAWTLESKDPNGFYFTSHTTTTANSQVSLTFNGMNSFLCVNERLTWSVGTSVTVVGIVHASNDTNPPAAASYTIDDFPSISLPLPFTSRDIPNQAFFESEELPLGAHKLTINVTTDGSPYILNSLTVCNKATNPVVAALVPETRTTTRNDVPIIVGVVVGVVVTSLLLLAGYFLYRRRKKGNLRPITRYPVLSWLRRGSPTPVFTSTESIMRNNPTNPSSIDPFDKLSHVEKQTRATTTFQLSTLGATAKTVPGTPVADLKAMPNSPILPASSATTSLTLHSGGDRQSTVSLIAPTLMTFLERLPATANPEGHTQVPHPPLPRDPPQPF